METKKLKVAVCLTGLIENRSAVSEYIRYQFDKIGEEHNIEFDFYCHFWKSDNLYPYIIDENILNKASLPKENEEGVQNAITHLSPKKVIRSSYADMQDLYFIEGMSQELHFNRTALAKHIGKDINSDHFYTANPEDAAKEFDYWWRLHHDWIYFAFLTSQFFATGECLKSIVNSNIAYDAVLKWRYDQVLMSADFDVNVIVKNLRYIRDSTLATEWMSQWVNGEQVFLKSPADGDKPPLTTNIEDRWWIVSLATAGFLAGQLAHAYANVKKYRTTFSLEYDGQHILFFYALRSLGIHIHLTGTITSFLVRDPELLPPLDVFADTIASDENLHKTLFDSHFTRSPHSTSINEIRKKKCYTYNAVKHFRFV